MIIFIFLDLLFFCCAQKKSSKRKGHFSPHGTSMFRSGAAHVLVRRVKTIQIKICRQFLESVGKLKTGCDEEVFRLTRRKHEGVLRYVECAATKSVEKITVTAGVCQQFLINQMSLAGTFARTIIITTARQASAVPKPSQPFCVKPSTR